MKVTVSNNHVERAMRILKKKMQKAKISDKIKNQKYHITNAEKKQKKIARKLYQNF